MRLGLLPGTFNPPTRAHLALARAALCELDEVVLVLPRQLPHKHFGDVPFAARMEMLTRAAGKDPRISAAVSDGGLFVEIAREAAAALPGADITLICGRDAAERIAGWTYPAESPIERQLDEFSLLVAARQGEYQPPPAIAGRVRPLPVDADYEWHSATEVRKRIAEAGEWAPLVPEDIWELVTKWYGAHRVP
jgi:nicotinic acid mononucleotide adenylyltransferase